VPCPLPNQPLTHVLFVCCSTGLAVDIGTVRALGLRAFFAAALGVIVPIMLSLAALSGALGANWRVGVAAGAAIAPTSLGFSAKLLGEVGQMQSQLGQLICAAAVIDDVLSLMVLSEVCVLGEGAVLPSGTRSRVITAVCLSQIQAFQSDTVSAIDLIIPLAGSLGTIVVGGLVAVYFQPYLKDWFVQLRVCYLWFASPTFFSLLLQLGQVARTSPGQLHPVFHYCSVNRCGLGVPTCWLLRFAGVLRRWSVVLINP